MKSTQVKTLTRETLDFAPGLLAIQESPPPRLPRAILLTVLALVAILFAWAMYGRLDIVASAEGRLVPESYVKIVQPAEGGVVEEILVRDGDRVSKGQILIRMNAKVTEADVRTVRHEVDRKKLQLRRIDAELSGRPMTEEAGDNPHLFKQVKRQHEAHQRAYLDAVASETAILEKTHHELQAAEELLQKLHELVPMYQNSEKAFEKLANSGFVGELVTVEKRRDRIEKEQDLRAQTATVASLKSVIAATEKRIAQITSNYQSELQNERVESEAEFKRFREELEKLEHKAGLLVLRAPENGIAKDLATHTPGTVVAPGTVLMSLVPDDEPVRAEVLVRNEDVGFVHEGQAVKLKLAAYPFQKYGMIEGTMSHIDPDAITVQEGDSAGAVGTLGYKALVTLDAQQLIIEDRPLRVTPGMQVVADIQLGTRTVMEYLLSPIQKAWLESGRER